MTGTPNWSNQTIWTKDNLEIMRGMNSVSVDLIYLDPPFNSKTDYAAPIGSQAAGAAFKDTWGLDDINLAWHGEIKHEYPGLYSLLNATREINSDSMMSYLIYMSIRIMVNGQWFICTVTRQLATTSNCLWIVYLVSKISEMKSFGATEEVVFQNMILLVSMM